MVKRLWMEKCNYSDQDGLLLADRQTDRQTQSSGKEDRAWKNVFRTPGQVKIA